MHIWESVSSSYWFVPSLMAAGAMLLAWGALELDRAVLAGHADLGWLYAGGVEGARSLLSTVASSTITVAGVVFSITIAALTQASNQFGPRLLRNFMRDTGNQVVLGTFVATYVYSILILRTIYGEGNEARVPQASITIGVLLAVASLAVLIYFIHHVSLSLQAPQVVAAVARDLDRTLAHQFPGKLGKSGEEPGHWPPRTGDSGAPVLADGDGYIQAIDQEGLLRLAAEHNVVLDLSIRPGRHIMKGMSVMHVHPQDRSNEDLARKLNATLLIGDHRTPEQDVEFAIDQLVEIGVRALSPGINDPFTAISCIDWLGVSLARIMRNGIPSRFRNDDQGQLRVVATVSSFKGLSDAAFNQIRQAGKGHVAVVIRLLEVIATLLTQLREPQAVAALLRHADMVYEDSQRAIEQEQDRADVQQRHAQVIRAARVPEAGTPPAHS